MMGATGARKRENPERLIEAFEDGDAPAEHVNSDHFAAMRRDFPQYLASTPRIISRQIDGSGWDRMSELQVD